MTDKITLNNLVSLLNTTTAVNTINNNNAVIVAAFDNTLSRDGTTPNQMVSNLDMNNSQILNLPVPATLNSPARLVDVVGTPTITVPPVGTSGGTVPLLNGVNTWSALQTFSANISVPSNVTLGPSSAQFLLNAAGTTFPNFQFEWRPTLSSTGAGGNTNSCGHVVIPQLGTLTDSSSIQIGYLANITSIPSGTKGNFIGYHANLTTSQTSSDVNPSFAGHLFGGTLTTNSTATYHGVSLTLVSNAAAVNYGLNLGVAPSVLGGDCRGINITNFGSVKANAAIYINGIDTGFLSGGIVLQGSGTVGAQALTVLNGASVVANLDCLGNIGVNTVTLKNSLVFSTTVPTVSGFTGLGSGGAVTFIAGATQNAGILLLHPGSSPSATGTVTFAFSNLATTNAIGMFTLADGTGGWTAEAVVKNTGFSSSSYVVTWINGASTALTNGSTYAIQYLFVGT